MTVSEKRIKAALSIAAITLIVVHLIWPNLTIDGVTVALLALAAVPWVWPYLKSLELPGGVKIELRDAKAATDKVAFVGQSEANSSGAGQLSFKEGEWFDTLRHVAERDPNLALVGVRIELEKRLLRLADRHGLAFRPGPLRQVVRQLCDKGAFPKSTAVGLIDLLELGNRAAHGADVSADAATWVLDMAPHILEQLDSLDREPSDL